MFMIGGLILRKGDQVVLNDKQFKMAVDAGWARHYARGSNNRDGGYEDPNYHLKGAFGEAAILARLYLERGPEVCATASSRPDVPEVIPIIEAKFGVPIEWKRKVKEDSLWVAWQEVPFRSWNMDTFAHHFVISRMAFGRDMIGKIPESLTSARAQEPWN